MEESITPPTMRGETIPKFGDRTLLTIACYGAELPLQILQLDQIRRGNMSVTPLNLSAEPRRREYSGPIRMLTPFEIA